MKKVISLTLALMLLLSLAVPTMAAELTNQSKNGATNLTVNTDNANEMYTLVIPADQEIAFGATSTSIGNITLSKANLQTGHKVSVTVADTEFTLEGQNIIPFAVSTTENGAAISAALRFAKAGDAQALHVVVSADDWAKGNIGAYKGTINFTSDVV